MLTSPSPHYCCLTFFSRRPEKQGASDAALKAYQEANEIAVASLPTTNPVRLGLALNFSVFYYEVLNQPDRACSLAQEAFDAAIGDMGSQQDEALKDSTLILQLLRDNLALWTDKNGMGFFRFEMLIWSHLVFPCRREERRGGARDQRPRGQVRSWPAMRPFYKERKKKKPVSFAACGVLVGPYGGKSRKCDV
jgi:hypothetical protein